MNIMTSEPLPSKSDRTNAAILEAAGTLFTSQGYAATSMRQVAESAGLALGSIYNHFPSKEAIFEEDVFPSAFWFCQLQTIMILPLHPESPL